jgi:uncharacterized membrane protein YeaQ/YmgE (transglycosylase-associated protein family)
MSIFAWIIVGLIAGWLADIALKGGGYGVMGGIVGALIGDFLAANFFGVRGGVSGLNLTSILVTFVGVVLTINILRDINTGDTRA